LLNQYEIELLDENDPGTRSKYRRRVKSLELQKIAYENELKELQGQATNEQSLQTQTITSQLQIIDNKIDLLLDNQFQLSQELLSHFDKQEQILLSPFTEKLDESQLLQVNAFLEAVDNDKISEGDIESTLLEIKNSLKQMNHQNLLLPESSKAIWGIIEDPKLDSKHSLKVTIPIIPFILSYEGELALGTGANIKNIWESLQSRFH
jgi:hypothetical protein